MAAGADSGQAVARAAACARPAVLELHLGELRQLFNSMDPAPFRERDLDPKASDYIVDWATEAPADQALTLVVHLGTAHAPMPAMRRATRCASTSSAAPSPSGASCRSCSGSAASAWSSAWPSWAWPSSSASRLAGLISKESYAWLVKESLVIGGWVALWRPLEIFLYDWWPLRAQAKLYDRLGRMQVERGMSSGAAVVQGARRHGARAAVLRAVAGHRPERQAGQPALRHRGRRRRHLGQPVAAAAGHRPRAHLCALLLLLPRFLWQSLVAGVDVARRAFSPSLPLNPGFVDYPVGLPRGSARNAFELISSLLPGSVPTDETEAAIEYHCLDVAQPVVEQLAAEERAHAPALVPGRRHG